MSPNLRPCYRYISSRGLDRLAVIFNVLFNLIFNLQQERTNEFCGEVRGQEFCFSPCTGVNGAVTRSMNQFSCYLYNNGKPDDIEMDPLEVTNLFDPLKVGPLSQAEDNVGRFCGHVGATEETESSTYCMQPCTDFNIEPGMAGPHPPPCVCLFRGGEVETFISLLSAPFARQVENERLYCPFSSLDAGRRDCQSDTVRMCRTDRQGVTQLPPGSSSCLVYFNGPTVAVGVLAASGFAGQIMAGLTAVSCAGAAATAGTMAAMNECTSPFCVARSGQCCLLAVDSRGLVCPLSC